MRTRGTDLHAGDTEAEVGVTCLPIKKLKGCWHPAEAGREGGTHPLSELPEGASSVDTWILDFKPELGERTFLLL